MGDVNLIPTKRLTSKRRLVRLRIWALVCGAYLASLAVASLSARVLWPDNDDAIVEQLTEASQSIEQYNCTIIELREKLAEETSALETIGAVSSQPDWSKLLILLSNELQEEVVLNSCRLVSLDKNDNNVRDHLQELLCSLPVGVLLAERRFCLSLGGFGSTQSSISQFVLRLEEIKIFESVRLIDSHRQPFGTPDRFGGEAVAFSIECRL